MICNDRVDYRPFPSSKSLAIRLYHRDPPRRFTRRRHLRQQRRDAARLKRVAAELAHQEDVLRITTGILWTPRRRWPKAA